MDGCRGRLWKACLLLLIFKMASRHLKQLFIHHPRASAWGRGSWVAVPKPDKNILKQRKGKGSLLELPFYREQSDASPDDLLIVFLARTFRSVTEFCFRSWKRFRRGFLMCNSSVQIISVIDLKESVMEWLHIVGQWSCRRRMMTVRVRTSGFINRITRNTVIHYSLQI